MQLSDFQDGFAAALLAPPDAMPIAAAWQNALVTQPGFSVYRNTVLKACIDALQANYVTVCSLVGEDWFRAAASLFARAHPPQDGRLMDYGAGFATFLQGFAPAAELPYLSAVARLDRCWTQAHLAADAPTLDAVWLARQPPEALAGIRLQPHPAACWAWCDEHPAYALWQRHRDGLPMDSELRWRGDGGLLTRPQGAVQWRPITSGGIAFLDGCSAAMPIEAAAAQALSTESHLDLPGLIAQLLQAGALRGIAATHEHDNNRTTEEIP